MSSFLLWLYGTDNIICKKDYYLKKKQDKDNIIYPALNETYDTVWDMV